VLVGLIAIGRTQAELQRRSIDEVLGISSGPSRRGSTYWSRALHCPFEHLLSNELGWQSTMPDDPLDTGLLWHYGLECYYKTVLAWQDKCRAEDPNIDRKNDLHFLRGADHAAQEQALRAIWPFSQEPGYEKIHESLSLMFDSYFTRWQSDKWEIVDAEVTIESQRFGFEYSSRLDLFIIDHAPAVSVLRVVEHKSAAALNSFITEGYTLDLQTMGQVWLVWREVDLTAYPPFMGSYINITSKQQTPKNERVPLSPTEPMLDAFASSMRRLSDTILDAWPRAGYPRNFASCTRRFGRCQFFSLCRNFPELDADRARAQDVEGAVPEGYKKRLPVVSDASE
jgi:hypothetical protein